MLRHVIPKNCLVCHILLIFQPQSISTYDCNLLTEACRMFVLISAAHFFLAQHHYFRYTLPDSPFTYKFSIIKM